MPRGKREILRRPARRIGIPRLNPPAGPAVQLVVIFEVGD
jgi:hypothetical protein